MQLHKLSAHETELHLNNGSVIFFSYNTPVAAMTSTGYLRSGAFHGGEAAYDTDRWLAGVSPLTVPQSVLDSMVEGSK